MAKSRYVAKGHRDKDKPFNVPNMSTLLQRSTKIIVSTCAARGFRIFAHDVDQCYLQSKDKLARSIYLQPHPRHRKLFELTEDEVLRLLKPLYGVCDAGDYWNATFTTHFKVDRGIKSTTGDPSLFVKYGSDDVDGIAGNYVDDNFLGGNEYFQKLTEKTLDTFESKPRQWDNVEFLGVKVTTDNGVERRFLQSQADYIKNLLPAPLDATFGHFTSVRASLAWVAHSRPNLCCYINRAVQVTEASYSETHRKELNKPIKYSKAIVDLL